MRLESLARESERTQVLKEVNATLRQYGMPEWESLKRIGRRDREGEHEILGVEWVTADQWHTFITIQFRVRRPDGTEGTMVVDFVKPTATILPIVNGQMILVRQDRRTQGKKTIEIPRGWIEWKTAEQGIEARARSLLAREIGQAWVDSLRIQRIVSLGFSPENTGRVAGACELLIVEANTTESLPRWSGVHEPMARTKEEFFQLIAQRVLFDHHSLSLIAPYLLWQQGVLIPEFYQCSATGGVVSES